MVPDGYYRIVFIIRLAGLAPDSGELRSHKTGGSAPGTERGREPEFFKSKGSAARRVGGSTRRSPLWKTICKSGNNNGDVPSRAQCTSRNFVVLFFDIGLQVGVVCCGFCGPPSHIFYSLAAIARQTIAKRKCRLSGGLASRKAKLSSRVADQVGC